MIIFNGGGENIVKKERKTKFGKISITIKNRLEIQHPKMEDDSIATAGPKQKVTVIWLPYNNNPVIQLTRDVATVPTGRPVKGRIVMRRASDGMMGELPGETETGISSWITTSRRNSSGLSGDSYLRGVRFLGLERGRFNTASAEIGVKSRATRSASVMRKVRVGGTNGDAVRRKASKARLGRSCCDTPSLLLSITPQRQDSQ